MSCFAEVGLLLRDNLALPEILKRRGCLSEGLQLGRLLFAVRGAASLVEPDRPAEGTARALSAALRLLFVSSSAQVTPFFFFVRSFPRILLVVIAGELTSLSGNENFCFLTFQSCLTQFRDRIAEESVDIIPVQLAVEQSFKEWKGF